MISDTGRHTERPSWRCVGSALASFRQHDFFDEYILSVHPILLGDDIPLFEPPLPTSSLELIDTTTYPSGLV